MWVIGLVFDGSGGGGCYCVVVCGFVLVGCDLVGC